jgi:hypothetical protein
MAKLTGTCWCGVLVTHEENGLVEIDEYKGIREVRATCNDCLVAECEAENASLYDAESGAGMERFLDWRYERLYPYD